MRTRLARTTLGTLSVLTVAVVATPVWAQSAASNEGSGASPQLAGADADGADADGADADDVTDPEAREHFEAATEYYDNTEYEDALVEFRRAYELASPGARPAMLFNVAASLERLGRFDESADALERYLDEADDPVTPARLRARIVSLRRRADANRARNESPDNPLLIAGGVTLGVAGVAAISFAVLGGLALAENNSLEDGCFATRTCVADDVATLESLTLGADISWIAAATAGAVGLGLLIGGAVSSEDSDAVAWLPILGPTGGGVRVVGAY